MDELDKATDSALGSGIRDNREKIKVDELIARYPNGVTIVAFEMCEGKRARSPSSQSLKNRRIFRRAAI